MNLEAPQTGSDAATLRQRLRSETAASHARLDRHFERVVEDEAVYHRFIRMNHACHVGIEPLLRSSALLCVIPDWPDWSRLPALEEDMRRMGLAPLPDTPFPFDCAALPLAAGVAYVLEGSRLGARFIGRRFAARSTAERWPDLSLCYIESAAGDDRFKLFMDSLSTLRLSESDRAGCVQAANGTFDHFEAVARLPDLASIAES